MKLTNKKICLIIDTMSIVVICTAMLLWTPHGRPGLHNDIPRSVFPVKGIDISAHNGRIDFAEVAADSVAFVMIKATEGTDFCDANFNTNYKAARSHNLAVGAYHFFRFETPGLLQAQHFINTVAGREFDLPLAIDVERTGNGHDQSITKVKRELHAMVDAIRSAGYPVMIYSNKKDRVKFIDEEFDDVPVWICSLSPRPPMSSWLYWQHSHGGKVAGISGRVDINTVNPKVAAGCSPVTPYTVKHTE